MFKSRLQEYAQKNSLPLPVYDTVNDGKDHHPQFKCTVRVNGANYCSPPGFQHKKDAENTAAQAAIEDLLNQGFNLDFKETRLLKSALNELATMKKFSVPKYQFTKEGDDHCPVFTATVEVNRVFYTGVPGNNKKDAAKNAAYEVILSIHNQDCISFDPTELQDENNAEKFTFENAPALPERINVEDP